MKFDLLYKPLLLLFAFLATVAFLGAQNPKNISCGTEITTESMSFVDSYKAQIKTFEQEHASLLLKNHHSKTGKGHGLAPLNSIPVKAHIIRKSSGSGGLSTPTLNEAISDLNALYADAFMEFFLCDGINYINNDAFYNGFKKSDEAELVKTHYTPGVINIYFTNSVKNTSGNSLCGYSNTLGGPDVIVMNNICATNGTSLSHEIGHFFSLMHTHGPDSKTTTTELVDGSNCDTDGDQICDTPADPKLGLYSVNTDCEYIGDLTDANGAVYAPDTGNIMSYSRSSCKSHFSPQQLARMYAFYKSARNYLSCPSMNVNITADVVSTCQNELTVTFEDLSSGATSWEWDVDADGIVDYTSKNPTHTFQTGIYDVVLTISNDSGTVTRNFVNFIKVGSQIEPLFEDFEDFDITGKHGWSAIDKSGKGYNWLVSDGLVHSKGTGPKHDEKSTNASNTYIFAEASGVEQGAIAEFISPCFYVEYVNSGIEFGYHMFGAHIGALHVDLKTEDGYINDVIPPLNGSQQQNQEDDFFTKNIDLSEYTGQNVQLRFRAVRGNGWDGDIAIDNIVMTTIYTAITDAVYKVYPNPIKKDNAIYIQNKAPKNVSTYSIMNLMGQELLKGTITDEPIDVSSISSGTYLLRISDGKSSIMKKIVK